MRCALPVTSDLRRLTPVALCSALAVVFVGCETAPSFGPGKVTQPLHFSHKRHFEADIDCLSCHEQAGDAPMATLPSITACMKCHKEPQGEHPDEAKVREYGERREEIPWIQVNRMAGHVYFSHRAHVTFAEMECDVCHGDMTVLDEPVSVPNVRLSMRECMNCHQKMNATNDCVACHK
jgi:menaquinone reductase, multiheme cytochrome c subunit